MLDLTKPLLTRYGRSVRVIPDIIGGHPYTIVGAYELNGSWKPTAWTKDGEFIYSSPKTTHPNDLVNLPCVIEKTLYLNFYEDGHFTVNRSRDSADVNSGAEPRFACLEIPVRAERGQGL